MTRQYYNYPALFFLPLLFLLVAKSSFGADLEIVFFKETRTFTQVDREGEVYWKGAFVCYALERASTESAVFPTHMDSGYSLTISGMVAEPTIQVSTIVSANSPLTTSNRSLAVIPSAASQPDVQGLLFTTSDQATEESVKEAWKRLASVMNFSGNEIEQELSLSVWSPVEQVQLQGKRQLVENVEGSLFNPELRPQTPLTYSWTLQGSGTKQLRLDVVPDVYRVRVEYETQSLDASNQPVDEPRAFGVSFASPTRVDSLFPVKAETRRLHRFLFDIASDQFETDQSDKKVWTLEHTNAGNTSVIVEKVTVSLIKTLPTVTWFHRGIEKHLQCVEPTSLSNASNAAPHKVRIRWRTHNFDGTEKLVILVARVGSSVDPVEISGGPFPPSHGVEDGEHGLLLVQELPAEILGEGQLKLLFRLKEDQQ
jgi:hypothetical protein